MFLVGVDWLESPLLTLLTSNGKCNEALVLLMLLALLSDLQLRLDFRELFLFNCDGKSSLESLER